MFEAEQLQLEGKMYTVRFFLSGSGEQSEYEVKAGFRLNTGIKYRSTVACFRS